VYKVAHRAHRPRGVLRHAQVVLYRASIGNGAPDDMPFFEQFRDPALGWNGRVEGGVDIVVVDGGHVTALREPHVNALAVALREAVEHAVPDLPQAVAA
jgi:thioesterase domain-containing protein